MTALLRNSLIGLLLAALAGAATWWWFGNMERRWERQPQRSQAAIDNPMLAATLLLRQHGHAVDVTPKLGQLDLMRLPAGTLILAGNAGVTTPQQTRDLLAWVGRGNTLVAMPQWRGGGDARDANSARPGTAAPRVAPPDVFESDPISARYGVRSGSGIAANYTDCSGALAPAAPDDAAGPAPEPADADADTAAEATAAAPAATPASAPPAAARAATPRKPRPPRPPRYACLRLPGATEALRLRPYAALRAGAHAPTPAWADAQGGALRAYPEGAGQVVVVAANYFLTPALRQADHAALLLGLSQLNGHASAVHIVLKLDMPRWYQALWDQFSLALLGLGAALLALLWRALRRFGPLLPEPAQARRALLEHIDASGRWLWVSAPGREQLLGAARARTSALLARRAPELLRLPPEEMARRLARLCQLTDADLQRALRDKAADQPAPFIRQIQTLQQVRAHYER